MKKKYGEAAKFHAINLREISGFPYPEIEAKTGIPEGYVRRLVHEKRQALLTQLTPVVTDAPGEVTQDETPVTSSATPQKPAINAAEMQVLPERRVTKPGFLARHFGLMDVAFYALNGTACFALWNVAPGVVGGSMALVYALFSLDAILRVKRAELPGAATSAANRVVSMEILAAFAHANLINDYLWRNLDKLPFRVYRGVSLTETRTDTLEIQYVAEWVNGDWVGFLSCVLAALMAFAACHAVFFTKNAAKERANIC